MCISFYRLKDLQTKLDKRQTSMKFVSKNTNKIKKLKANPKISKYSLGRKLTN